MPESITASSSLPMISIEVVIGCGTSPDMTCVNGFSEFACIAMAVEANAMTTAHVNPAIAGRRASLVVLVIAN
jgi:hypothetical protein